MNDPATALAAHHRHEPAGQVVPAEEIGLELLAQGGHRQILDRARLRIGAIVEQSIDPAAGPLQH